jgi:hypothetical protein
MFKFLSNKTVLEKLEHVNTPKAFNIWLTGKLMEHMKLTGEHVQVTAPTYGFHIRKLAA